MWKTITLYLRTCLRARSFASFFACFARSGVGWAMAAGALSASIAASISATAIVPLFVIPESS
jgi:hypothetical protein